MICLNSCNNYKKEYQEQLKISQSKDSIINILNLESKNVIDSSMKIIKKNEVQKQILKTQLSKSYQFNPVPANERREFFSDYFRENAK